MKIKHALLLALLMTGCSQTTPPVPPPATTDTSAAPQKEPAAMQRLTQMGAYLRTLKSFTVRGTTHTDEVLLSGQKVTLSSSVNLEVQRPDKLHATVRSDRKEREFFYDGDRFTVFAPTMNYFATTPAPPTIRELVDHLHERFGIELPFVDLFYWGDDEAKLDQIVSALVIGRTTIHGVQTEHLAFQSPGLDWQIWIERGERPIPHMLVLTTTTDSSRPEHVVTMEWDLAPKLSDKQFSFVPPSNAQQIVFNTLTPSELTARRR